MSFVLVEVRVLSPTPLLRATPCVLEWLRSPLDRSFGRVRFFALPVAMTTGNCIVLRRAAGDGAGSGAPCGHLDSIARWTSPRLNLLRICPAMRLSSVEVAGALGVGESGDLSVAEASAASWAYHCFGTIAGRPGHAVGSW